MRGRSTVTRADAGIRVEAFKTIPKPRRDRKDRSHGETGYTSSPERGGGVGISTASVGSTGSSTGPGSTTSSRYPPGSFSAGSSYEDPYYSQYSGTVTPVIDEEAR
ncbi:hypothetical protein TSAR_013908 [Trichomalopsis sarcophagae]|uniref:Uncharacterized protein n=1 Tax=Trichomalopsis sarcophagae TaxID=543379 RepID=A0A232FKN3_9HYME|nr:hypothetical protein TSAR_013908 [Trichomalopsis sarcophagae]